MLYIFVDTETGGLDPEGADVLQLAWCVTNDSFSPGKTRSFYMRRMLPITPEALKVNGLTDEILKETATDPYDVYQAFLKDLYEADVLVAHYAKFDKAFIREDCKRRLPHDPSDTAELIAGLLQNIRTVDTKTDFIGLNKAWGEKKHPGPYLDELCRFLGVETHKLHFHRAEHDVEAMRLCMRQMKYMYSDTIPG